ncbi:MAG: hypothetical protein ABR563_08440 [Pyrinomonadaceae bacterium]
MTHDTSVTHATTRTLLAAAFASALCLAAQPATVSAQSSRSAVDRGVALRKADEAREMEMKRLELAREARAESSPAARLALRQIGEDFRQMQIVNNEMMRAAFPAGAPRALDYDGIAKATAEINRRAARLRANLQFPRAQGDPGGGAGREIGGEREMRSSLLSLDGLITSFVNNPTFRKQGVLDAQESGRAHRDLQAVIRLSQKIRQRADRLK